MRNFTEEQNMFRDAYRKFLESEVAPHIWSDFASRVLLTARFSKKAGEQGFLDDLARRTVRRHGRQTTSALNKSSLKKPIVQGCAEWFNTLHSRLVGPYIDTLGNDEQKQRFLPGCISGDKILAIAMTEPDAGSDLAGMRSPP